MESSTLLGFAVGVGCGICISCVLFKRHKAPTSCTKVNEKVASIVESVVGISGNSKLVLVVRTDLKMGKGKIAAQCAHASVISYDNMLRTDPDRLHEWRLNGQPKIVTKVESQEQIMKVAEHARSLGLTAGIVRDAGRTQIAPGSLTVVSVGPGPIELVDQVTGHLKLM